MIGEVAATAQLDYEWNDLTPLIGENLYRLAHQSYQEATIYSTVAVANCTAQISDIVVYPNPSKNKVYIQLYSDDNLALPYQLTNSLGQLLYQGALPTQEGVNTFPLPVQDYPQGIYLLHVQGKTIKIVKN